MLETVMRGAESWSRVAGIEASFPADESYLGLSDGLKGEGSEYYRERRVYVGMMEGVNNVW